MFDVISFLEEYNIDYTTSGKNVTSGWVEINCPFCGDDPSYHMGVNLSSGLYHCWICGAKGGSEKLIQKLLGISFSKVHKIISDFEINIYEQAEAEKSKAEKIYFPKGFENHFPEMHINYLTKRRFDHKKLIQKYGIKAYLHLGREFAYRIVVPIIMDNQIVNFVGRDVTEKSKEKYINLKNEKAIIPLKNCLYNIDSVKDTAIIVEGIFDAWRIGDGCVATMGVEYTVHQLRELYEKELKKAFIMYDHDALKKAYKLGNILSTFIPRVEVIELEHGDPADMKEEEVSELLKEIKIS
jgi:DNA primase